MYKSDCVFKEITKILVKSKLPRNEVIYICDEIKNNIFIDIICDEVAERIK